MRTFSSSRGFTLVELIVSMSLGTVVMAAVFSTYLYLGRNLTRLSYQNTLEAQSRTILTTLGTDIRYTKSVQSASVTGLNLIVYNQISVNGPVPFMKVVYAYNTSTTKLTRTISNLDDSGPVTITLNYDIITNKIPVSLPAFSFLYYTTSGTSPVSQFDTNIVPMSIKQVAISFTLQAGTPSIQGQQGTLTSYQVNSGRMPLMNRQLPDGT